ncbi:MAG TPA: hypothetical protein VF833_01155 [Gaiellaceae bacterium]
MLYREHRHLDQHFWRYDNVDVDVDGWHIDLRDDRHLRHDRRFELLDRWRAR